MAGEQQDSLCQRCQSIDFEAFLPEDASPELVEPLPTLILGQITPEWTAASCRLCQF